MLRTGIRLLGVAALLLLTAKPAVAYVDLAPTLRRIIGESKTILVAEVDRWSRDKGAVILKKIRDLKGQSSSDLFKHMVQRADEPSVDWPILDWAEPGRRCVVFVSDKSVLVCLGEGWYQVHKGAGDWWRIGAPRPDLPLAYYGTVSRLAGAIPVMVAGKSAVITTLPHGADREGASFDLALNRAGLPGLVKVQRIRANLRMPDVAMGVGSNPAFVLGMGRASRDDVTSLREQLKSADKQVRAESAADLGFLGVAAMAAAPDLTKLLDDEASEVRLAAASALLRVNPVDARALDVLAKGLASATPGLRRQAARAAGLAGPGATPLANQLGSLLQDEDILTRHTALQAIATMGPAAPALVTPLMALLKDQESAADAADALGRMGATARPAAKALVSLLAAEAPAQRWAALRALAQIGGDDAAPAVKFMMDQLPRATEYEAYNMMIYLALLGPMAKDALPAIRSARVRNGMLREATAWAVNPGTDLPRLNPMGEVDFVQYIWEAYIHELGDHLKPVAQSLVKKIMAGKAGNVHPVGFKLLARYPENSLAVLTPGLADKDKAVRERAAVALGYMGKAAAAAKIAVAQALKTATDEREQRLLQWCLRELE